MRLICLVLTFVVSQTLVYTQISSIYSLNDDQHAIAAAMIERLFPNKEITFTPLAGGYSGALTLRVDGRYVLRVQDTLENDKRVQRELFAMKEADRLGIGPHIHHVGFKDRAVLMDYIEGGTLTIDRAKQPENCLKVAHALRKAHGTPRNPYPRSSFKERIEALYEELKDHIPSRYITEAIERARKLNKDIKNGALPKANIHGDLNSRNIFITDKGAIFIDWSQTNWEDPFYDLSCFAIMHDYNREQERLLLANYLGNPPTKAQQKHYDCIKKINLAHLCLTCHYIMYEQLQKNPQKIDESAAIRPWSYYARTFADDQSSLAPQFFYEAGISALNEHRAH